MATTATAVGTLPLRRPNLITICAKEAKYEFLKTLRFPMYTVGTVVMPLMFYVLFGLVMGRQMIGAISTTLYLIPSYGTFGVMGASLYGTAAGLASERGLGWLQVKRASPMPIFAYFLAKVVMSLIFCTVDVMSLMLMVMTFCGVNLAAGVAARLLGILIAGSVPFCAMGLAIGYFASPNSAPAVINLFYLPMSFCSGLWMPFMFLPHFVKKIALVLPPYHLSQLAFNAVGAGQGGPMATHWQTLVGFTLLCMGVAWVGHQRDQKLNG